MKLIPYRQIILKSEMNSDELIRKLKTKVVESTEDDFSSVNQHKLYTGTISPDGFRMRRKIYYASPARTEIIGVITPLNNGSSINVRFELNTVGIIFNSFILLLVVASFPTIAAIIFSGENLLLVLIPFGLSLITLLITILPFKYEERLAIKLLLDITKGKMETDRP